MKKLALMAFVISSSLFPLMSLASSNWEPAMKYPKTGEAVKKLFFNNDKSIYLLSAGLLHNSKDQGKSWKVERKFLWANSVFSDNANHVFANAIGPSDKLELVRLVKKGPAKQSWERLKFDAFIDALAVDNNNKIIYAHIIENPTTSFNENEIYRSDDLGEHWQATGFKAISKSDRWHAVSLAMDSYNNLYAGNLKGLFKFSKNTRSWQPINTNSFNVVSTDGGIVIDKHDNIYVATHEGRVYRFTNGGQTMTLIADLHQTNCIIGMVSDKNDNLYIGTSHSGVYKLAASDNKLKLMNTGLPSLATEKLAMDTSGNLYVTLPEKQQIYELKLTV